MYTINYLMPLLHLFLFLSGQVSAKVIWFGFTVTKSAGLFSDNDIVRDVRGGVCECQIAKKISYTLLLSRCSD